MKNCIVWLFLGVLLGIFVACDREEDLKPSGLDTERLRDSLDLEYPLVREYYDDEEDFCMTRVYTIDVDRAVETGRDVYVPQISFPFRREK